jgi:hypothetical protein
MIVIAPAAIGAARGWFTLANAPTWYVLWRAGQPDVAMRQAALSELARRDSSGSLTPAQHLSLCQRIIDAQADGRITWSSQWGDVVESTQYAGGLAAADWDRYCRAMWVWDLKVRKAINRGQGLPVRLTVLPGRHGSQSIRVRYMMTRFLIDGISCNCAQIDGGYTMTSPSSHSADWTDSGVVIPWAMAVGWQNGEHSVTATASAKIDDGTNRPSQSPQTVELHATWNLLPPDQPTLTVTHSPELGPAIAAMVHAMVWKEPTPADSSLCELEISCNQKPPVDLMWKVSIESRGRRIGLGTVRFTGAIQSHAISGFSPHETDLDPAGFDLFFEPMVDDVNVALDATQIWGETLRIRDIKIGPSPWIPRRKPTTLYGAATTPSSP